MLNLSKSQKPFNLNLLLFLVGFAIAGVLTGCGILSPSCNKSSSSISSAQACIDFCGSGCNSSYGGQGTAGNINYTCTCSNQ